MKTLKESLLDDPDILINDQSSIQITKKFECINIFNKYTENINTTADKGCDLLKQPVEEGQLVMYTDGFNIFFGVIIEHNDTGIIESVTVTNNIKDYNKHTGNICGMDEIIVIQESKNKLLKPIIESKDISKKIELVDKLKKISFQRHKNKDLLNKKINFGDLIILPYGYHFELFVILNNNINNDFNITQSEQEYYNEQSSNGSISDSDSFIIIDEKNLNLFKKYIK